MGQSKGSRCDIRGQRAVRLQKLLHEPASLAMTLRNWRKNTNNTQFDTHSVISNFNRTEP
ncbi:hypothetical protein E2C01_063140 [Portunus trituberculatus]|uniref:Uncharacterized protein n=1 Tax=Portunus trituberculatus TaxID=210409 RepID=A0A5B7HGQ0_PORTR|nr:hypothetical protein [Portunus trituberculatus]